MEKVAKRLIRITSILWIIAGSIAIIFGFIALGDPSKSGSATIPIIIGLGIFLLTLFVNIVIKNQKKAWARWALLILIILSWITEVWMFLGKGQIDLIGLIFFTVPITIIWYYNKSIPQLSVK